MIQFSIINLVFQLVSIYFFKLVLNCCVCLFFLNKLVNQLIYALPHYFESPCLFLCCFLIQINPVLFLSHFFCPVLRREATSTDFFVKLRVGVLSVYRSSEHLFFYTIHYVGVDDKNISRILQFFVQEVVRLSKLVPTGD